MPGLIIGGRELLVPGLTISNWNDHPGLRLKMGEDGRKRSAKWVREIGVHSTKGIPGSTSDKRAQVILPGLAGPSTNDERVAKFWSTDPTSAGAHLVVDHDAHIVCLADLLTEVAFHAGASNATSIGIETYQGNNAEFYDGQLDAVVLLIDAITFYLTEWFSSPIQRQFHSPYVPYKPLDRTDGENATYCGIYGHRDQTANRGPGDPGPWLEQKLSAAGYEAYDFQKGADRDAWRERQAALGIDADGIPGPGTAAAIRAQSTAVPPCGIWVNRPMDALIGSDAAWSES